jgi:hypothetical protein
MNEDEDSKFLGSKKRVGKYYFWIQKIVGKYRGPI